VIALYVEASSDEIARVTTIAKSFAMTIAIAAPDSLLAVADAVDVGAIKAALSDLRDGRAALGKSRATICGDVVDGAALDVESWAPYPLMSGLWLSPDLE
jgi:hypothetical protein